MLKLPIILQFNSHQEWKVAQVPFIQNGLLMQCDPIDYQLGQPVALQLKLWNIPHAFNVSANVVWLAPIGAGLLYTGVGVQFDAEAAKLIQKTLALEPIYVS